MSDVIRYNSRAIFTSTGRFDSDQTSDGSLYQFSRVQDLGINISHPISDEDYLDSNDESSLNIRPTVDVTLNWLLSNGANERSAGFVTNGLSGALLNLDTQKNIYILTEQDNIDAIGSSTPSSKKSVFGIGNTLMSSYTLSASIGSFVNASASFIGLNLSSYTGTSTGMVPAVNYTDGSQVDAIFSLPVPSPQKEDTSSNEANNVSALHPKDIVLEFQNANPFGVKIDTIHLQSFEVNFSFERFDEAGMGTAFPESRPLLFPVDIEFTTEALVPSHYVDNLANNNCLGTGASMNLIIKRPCSEFAAFELKLREMKLEGQSFGQSIGAYESVTLQWRGRVTDPFSLSRNVFMEAFQGELVYSLVNTIPITGYDNNGVQYYAEESIYERKLNENTYVFTP